MTTPTNTGFVFLTEVGANRATVLVCSAISGGKPVDVTAIHGPKVLDLDPSVKMVDAGAEAYSTETVHVWADDDGVHVRRHSGDVGPLMKKIDR
jgi:hypothetical protein